MVAQRSFPWQRNRAKPSETERTGSVFLRVDNIRWAGRARKSSMDRYVGNECVQYGEIGNTIEILVRDARYGLDRVETGNDRMPRHRILRAHVTNVYPREFFRDPGTT